LPGLPPEPETFADGAIVMEVSIAAAKASCLLASASRGGE
jgi:hypothetical protein